MTVSEEPAVKVTLSTIYERVVSVEQQVTKLGTDLPTHVSLTKDKQDEYEKRLENHGDRLAMLDTRVTLLESSKKPTAPWYSVIGGIAGVGSALVSAFALLTILSKLSQI